MDRRFVVISGVPGSGKSTLARRLSVSLGLPLIDKDDILDQLFESKGSGDHAWRRTLSRESDRILHSHAEASDGAVLVSFWHQPGMAADSGTPTRWLLQLSRMVVNVRCLCPTQVAAVRYFNRKRHPGHLDSDSFDDVLTNIGVLEDLDPIDIRPRVDVDTTSEPDVSAVTADINDAFSRCVRPHVHHFPR